MRTKTVYPSQEVCHLWANGGHTSARNPRGNVYIGGDNGELIFSYGGHYCMARRLSNNLFALNSSGTSVTTRRHLGMVWRAIGYNAIADERRKVVRVSQPERTETYMSDFQSKINSIAERANRPRLRANTRAVLFAEGLQVKTESDLIAEYLGVEKLTFPDSLESLRQLAEDNRAQQAKAEADRQAEREARQAEYYKLHAACKQATIEQWLNGGLATYNCPVTEYHAHHIANFGTFLRLEGDEVNTSRYVTVPVDHAKCVFALLQCMKEKGQTYQRNGHTIHLGVYTVDSFDGETLKAGCHTITWAEIERFAKSQGW